VRVVDASGQQLGIMDTRKALEIAYEQGLDLVEVAPAVTPPVCKIMDFAKYKYDQIKKEREAKKHRKGLHLKEVRLRPHIEEHDFQVKLKQVQKFLEKGNKVRLRMFYRGREMEHQEIGRKIIERIIKEIEHVGKIEKQPQMFGKMLIVVLSPHSKKHA